MKDYLRVSDFYDGKSILITGAAGFLGSVLLEILLGCFPGIQSIYILLRPKKGVEPHKRKDVIFNKKIFSKIKEKQPELLEKVHVVAGDVSQKDLGMNREDLQRIVDEVSIVFHSASVINFIKPYRFALEQNSQGTDNVVQLCRKLKKIDVLVYTSTAYANINRITTLKEKVYRLPFVAQEFLDALKEESDEKLHDLISECKPDWPSSYFISKCLAENIIQDKAMDIPVAIIRPSIIVSCWNGNVPGYVEDASGITLLTIGVGKGFIKVLHADPDCEMDLVPADIVANTHVIAAWSVATKRFPSPFVVHCTADENLQGSLAFYTDNMKFLAREFPLPNSFQKMTSFKIVANDYLYWIIAFYEHYAPGYVYDWVLKFHNKKPKIIPLYRLLDKAMDSLRFGLMSKKKIIFEKENIAKLIRQLHPDDKKMLEIDMKDFDVPTFQRNIPKGAPFYDWKTDKRSFNERQKVINQRYWIHNFIKVLLLLLSAIVFCTTYFIASFTLRLLPKSLNVVNT